MNFLATTLTGLLLANSAMASNEMDNRKALLGAETMVRQVLTKKLLAKNEQSFYVDLQRSLNGINDSGVGVVLSKIRCERGPKSDTCVISVFGKPDSDRSEVTEYSFDLNVRIIQGDVIGAGISNMAG